MTKFSFSGDATSQYPDKAFEYGMAGQNVLWDIGPDDYVFMILLSLWHKTVRVMIFPGD